MAITRRAVKGSRLTTAEGDANLDPLDRLTPVILTISAGIITVSGPGTYRVEVESGTTDDVTQINGSVGHEWLVTFRLNTGGRTIRFLHTPGSGLYLAGGTNPGLFTLDSVRDTISFQDRITNE